MDTESKIKPRLLIADDDATLLMVAGVCLRKAGFEVVEVADGEQAIEKALEEKPDLVVLDVNMPKKNGYEACRVIRATVGNEHIPILMMTAMDNEGQVHSAYKAGASEFVVKPINWIVEAHRLKNMLKASEAIHQVELSRLEWVRTFNAIDDMVMVLDEELRIIQSNDAANELLFGESDRNAAHCCDAFNPEDDAECTSCLVRRAFKTGKIVSEEKDDFFKGRTYQVAAFPIMDEGGKVIRVVHTARDITVRLQLEEEVRRAQKMDAVGALSGGLAHDFNNLLQAIMGYAELMASDMDESNPAHDDIEHIKKAVRQGRDVTRQLLTVSRRTESRRQLLELNPIIRGVVKLLSRTIPVNISIDLDLSESLDSIRADASQLEQILMNLAVNAKHAMLDGGILTFRSYMVEQLNDADPICAGLEPGNYTVMEVRDTGIGMDHQTTSRIFEPFFTTRTPDKGTGLGLSMVYGIIKKHGAFLNCSSELGKGSVFTVYFPVFDAGEHVGNEVEVGESQRILFIADDVSVRRIIGRILTISGYMVETAEDRAAALKVVRDNECPVGLAILDLSMPDLDSIEFVEEIRKYRPNLPVLLESGTVLSLEERECFGTNAGFIEKPYSEDQLLDGIRQLLDNESGPDM